MYSENLSEDYSGQVMDSSYTMTDNNDDFLYKFFFIFTSSNLNKTPQNCLKYYFRSKLLFAPIPIAIAAYWLSLPLRLTRKKSEISDDTRLLAFVIFTSAFLLFSTISWIMCLIGVCMSNSKNNLLKLFTMVDPIMELTEAICIFVISCIWVPYLLISGYLESSKSGTPINTLGSVVIYVLISHALFFLIYFFYLIGQFSMKKNINKSYEALL